MSDIQGPGVRSHVTVDIAQFERGITRAGAILTGLEPIVANQWWGLQNLSRAFMGVGTAVAAGFGFAVREAVAWESAMVGVQRTTSALPEEMKEIEAGLRRVANTTPIAVSELAALAEQFGALGVANEAIPEAVRIMGTLIASTNLTTSSVEDMARTMNVLGVPQEAFERFASTLLDVGRNTAATETEILNLARRLAPMTRMAGFTADQVLGLSAAIISLGPRAEAGGSAATRAIADISRAIAENGDDLQNWAQVAGMSAAQFAQAWKTDASGAFEQVIVGLGRFEGDIVGLTSTLDHLDQTNVRNVLTLGALANGITDVNNEQTSLIAINDMSREAWRNNTAMQEVAEARAKTFAAQLVIFQNRLAAVGNAIGAQLLPYLGFLLDRVQDLIAGFASLPGWLQTIIGGFAALVGGVFLLVGSLLALIGPVVLMISSWRAIRKVLDDSRNAGLGTKASLDAVTGSVNANSAAVQRNTGVWIQNRNAQGQFAKGGQRMASTTNAAATATSGLAVAAPVATRGLKGLWEGMGRLTRVAAILSTVLTVGSIALSLFGNRARAAEKDVESKIKQDEQLVNALEEVRKGNITAADSYILQKVAAADLLDVTQRLQVSYGMIVRIIKGMAPPKEAADLVKRLNDAAKNGDAGAKKIIEFMARERAVYVESARAAGILGEARKDLGDTNDDTAETEANLAANTDKAREAQDKANQAAMSYVDAVFAHRRAVMATADAQEEYNKVLADAADPTIRLARAENDLVSAQNDHRQSQRDLLQAEKDLLTARQDQLEDLQDAEEDLIDANDTYLDSLDKISDLEEEIADRRSGPSSRELLEATNKLANAHLALRAAERGVRDAEWQLQYLREEGASNRDIEDAEFALDEARQDVADQTEAVGEAEEDLREMREGFPEEIIRLERDLARARRDSDNALEEIQNRERDVQTLRDDIAADTAYLDAQAAVADAHDKVYGALQNIRDAELELQKIRSGAIQEEVADAQLDLEEALYAEARAATAVQKEQAAMRKQFWDSGQEAHALADNLAALLDQAPTPEARKRLLDHIALLRQAVSQPEKPAAGAAGGGGGVPTVGAEVPGLKVSPKATQDMGKTLGQKIKDALITAFSTLVGGLVGRLIMILVATFLGITGGWAILAGVIIGALVGWLLEKFLKSEIGKKLIDGLISGMTAAAGALGRFFHSLWFDFIWGPIKSLFGIGSPSKEFGKIGGWLIDGLLEGLAGGLGGLLLWFVSLPLWVLEKFADAGLWLVDKGGAILGGLWNGLVSAWGKVWEWVSSIPGKIGGVFSNAYTWLTTSGKNFIIGLGNGAIEAFGNVISWFGRLPGRLWDILAGGGEALVGVGKNLIIGLWNGIVSMWDWFYKKAHDIFTEGFVGKVLNFFGIASPSTVFAGIGKNIMLGFAKGIVGNLDQVDSALNKLDQAVTDHIPDDVFAQFDDARFREALAAQAASLPALLGAGGSQTTNNNSESTVVNAQTNADPQEIAHEVAWTNRVRRRG